MCGEWLNLDCVELETCRAMWLLSRTAVTLGARGVWHGSTTVREWQL